MVYTHTHTHTHNGISLDHKKETLPVVTIHLEDITLSEISQTEKDKHDMSSLIHEI